MRYVEWGGAGIARCLPIRLINSREPQFSKCSQLDHKTVTSTCRASQMLVSSTAKCSKEMKTGEESQSS